MILQKLHDTAIALKSGSGVLAASTDGTLKIGSYSIEGPGEYDSAGIGLTVSDDLAVAVCEGIQIALVWGSPKPESTETASVDILVSFIDNATMITNMVKSLDPRIIVFLNPSVATEVATKDGITLNSVSNYKITAATLPADIREAVLLL